MRSNRFDNSATSLRKLGRRPSAGVFFCKTTFLSPCLILLPSMKYYLLLVLAAVALPALQAAEKLNQSGKSLDIQQETRTRVLYYQVDTPVTKADPYFEVSVQVGDTIYVGDY